MSTPTTISRAERTLATRRRMVRAAYDLFCANGYLGTTISAVAAQAGVAVPTVYYTFGTKAALLDESIGAAIGDFDRWPVPPTGPVEITELLPWHGWWAEFEAASTSAAALDIFVTNGVGILQRVGPLITAMHGATGDADAAQVVATAEERRVDSYREAVRVIARKPGGLRRGVSAGGRDRHGGRAVQRRALPVARRRPELVAPPVRHVLPGDPDRAADRHHELTHLGPLSTLSGTCAAD